MLVSVQQKLPSIALANGKKINAHHGLGISPVKIMGPACPLCEEEKKHKT